MSSICLEVDNDGVVIVESTLSCNLEVQNSDVIILQSDVPNYVEIQFDVLVGPKGDKGDKGDDGLSAYEVALLNGFVGTELQWLDSLKGIDGINGVDGINGTNGLDGDDGISAYQVAVNNGFIGTESQWLNSLIGPQGSSFDETFETFSKNLKGSPFELNYTLGTLSSIVYTVPVIGTITKSFFYTGSKLTSIVLSGATPSGINLTKTFNYTGDILTSISYS